MKFIRGDWFGVFLLVALVVYGWWFLYRPLARDERERRELKKSARRAEDNER
jgi:hypothetical protein